MTVFLLDDSLLFPPAELADKDGLLAIGGDLSPERLLLAYSKGIFPWYNPNEPILWWSPDPRLVLFPKELHISKRLKRIIRQKKFQVTFNKAFKEVIASCAHVRILKGEETWIGPDMITAYTRLYELGFCMSVEAWLNKELVGGLYGVLIGKVFFGESMFSKVSNASKVALVQCISMLQSKGLKLVDCQVETSHLKNFGARLIPRKQFISFLEKWTIPLKTINI